mmetsp:Transcript_83103/g.164863  ORF Transcript_83103/g.164863 Transcript_83103/m.164863 type:complete len:469 (-) Transcript_83103:10-1416(-)
MRCLRGIPQVLLLLSSLRCGRCQQLERIKQQFWELSSDACDLHADGARANVTALSLCLKRSLDALGMLDADEDAAREQIVTTCIGRMQGLATSVTYAGSTQKVCWATPGLNMTAVGCEALTALAHQVLVLALRFLALCTITGDAWADNEKEATADETLQITGQVFQNVIEQHTESPPGCFFVSTLKSIQQDLLLPLSPSSHARQLVSRALVASRRLSERANFLVWRDTHFLWLEDSLRQGEVVQTSWGPVERWDELGANDARSVQPLIGAPATSPFFSFSDEVGQRRDILVSLLRKLHESRGAGETPLVVAEIGVFRAGLSKHILEKLPFVRLIGVDPYIGVDGTFPGDFSQTMHPDQALAEAQATFSLFGKRAQLLPETSEAAARRVPDGSLDAVFVDGCHLYKCVSEDLRFWTPKLRQGLGRGATLVAGHDFSPQWPGVVRAVHEHRAGHRVFLGHDWMYWWYPAE